MYSPDGKLIAACGDEGIHVWDAVNGELLRTLTGHKVHAESCAFSPDSKAIVSTSASLAANTEDYPIRFGMLVQVMSSKR